MPLEPRAWSRAARQASARKPHPGKALATLDAATRLLDSLIRSGGLKRGSGTARVLERFCSEDRLIPERFWSARPGPESKDDEEQVLMRGAVLVRALGKRVVVVATLGPELAAALNDPPSAPAGSCAA